MADSPIKKVVIKKEDLPAFDGNTQQYSVRYRIISEDRNRSSHWSPYYLLDVPEAEKIDCSVSVNNNVVNMVWKQPANLTVKQYDIYFKLGSSPNDTWQYIASTTSLQFSTLIADSVSTLTVAIQLPTYPKSYFPMAAMFTSAPITV